MKQNERRNLHYDQVMRFLVDNHRRTSKYRLEEYQMLNWMEYTKKAIDKGSYPSDRREKIKKLMETEERYKIMNQYT